MLTGGFKLTPW